MVMEYLPGTTLQGVLKLGRPTTELTIEIAEQIADALDYAHANNIVHRDLKPANIIFSDRNQPVIVDFGLAKLAESGSDLTGTGQVLGTPSYMPPEQAAAQVSAIAPSLERVKPFSCNILASTGKAVMLMEMPMNNAKDKNVIFAGA